MMCHITEAELALAPLFCMSSRYFLALTYHFSAVSVADCDAELTGEVKVLKVHIRASRAIPYRSSCVVIWHIVSFGQKYTERPQCKLAKSMQKWNWLRFSLKT